MVVGQKRHGKSFKFASKRKKKDVEPGSLTVPEFKVLLRNSASTFLGKSGCRCI